MGKGKKPAQHETQKETQLKQQVRAEPATENRRLAIRSEDFDTFATWLTLILFGVSGLAARFGHDVLSDWFTFLALAFACVAIVWHAHEKHWPPRCLWKRPWILTIAAVVSMVGVATWAQMAELAEPDRLASLEARLRSRSELLTPQVRARLIEQLKTLPPKSVVIVVSTETTEAKEFAALLVTTLTKAGCLDKHVFVEGPGVVNIGDEGIVVDNQPDVANSANKLGSALTAAGIPDVKLVALPSALRSPPGKVTVWIFREKIRD